MFRELLQHCVTSNSGNETYSLSFQNNQFETHIFLNFWTGNVFYQVCLGTGPRGTLVPKKMMGVVASFLSLFDVHPSCICLIDCPESLNSCFKASLPGCLRPTSVNGFGPSESERCLSLPTSRILERHDYRTILDFLLMKLRTALDRDWLQSLPTLHKVRFRSHYEYSYSNSCVKPFVLQCVIDLSYSPKEASYLIETLSLHWDKVLDHLNRVSRLPSYRFHMREVCIVSF